VWAHSTVCSCWSSAARSLRDLINYSSIFVSSGRWHQLGVALIWLSTVVLAFDIGYSRNRHMGQTASVIGASA